MDKGFFEEEKPDDRAAARRGRRGDRARRCMSGDYQIGFSNTTSLIIAASQEPAGPDHLPGRARRDRRRTTRGTRVRRARRAPTSRRSRTSRARRSRSTRSTTSAQVDDQQRAREGRRRLHEGQVRRGPVPRHERGARGRARRRGVHGRAGVLRRPSRPARRTLAQRLRGDRAEPARSPTYFATKQYIAREPRRRRALPARDAEVARVRVARTTDEVRAVVGDVHARSRPEVTDKMHLPTWKADLNEPTIEQTLSTSR